MRFTFAQFIKDQFTAVPPVATVDLTGKTVIVTGANNGLGFEAAKHFGRMNPGKLILACRSKEKGERALAELQRDTSCKTAQLRLLDLTSFSSVKSFVAEFESENERLDILLENAGIMSLESPVEFTGDGWEQGTQVNDLSPSLLALLLLPRILRTASKFNTVPRIVVVASELHYWAKFEKKMIEAPNPFRLFAHKDHLKGPLKNRYEETKLLNVFFVRELSDRLRGKPIVVNSVNPGFCRSGLGRNFSGLRGIGHWVFEKILARTTEVGSRNLVWAAVGPEQDNLRGAYVSLCAVNEPSDYVISKEGHRAQTKLWDSLIEELTQVDPKINDIIDNNLSPV